MYRPSAPLATGALVALLLTMPLAWGQGVGSARVGYLTLYEADALAPVRSALVGRLAELGWREGRNLVFDPVHAFGKSTDLERQANVLAQRAPQVIVASGISAVLAAKRAAPATPIVIAGASDPMAFGLVASLGRPGGNVTGVADTPGRELEGKRLQLLKEIVPGAMRVAVILDSAGRRDPAAIAEAAKALGLALSLSPETVAGDDFRRSFAMLKRGGAQAVYAPETPANAEHRDLIISLAIEHRLPVMYGAREFVEAGGLVAYGPSYIELHRRAAEYVDRILRGAKPESLPVEQPTRLELSVNLKAAAAIGLTVPAAVLLRADHLQQ